VKQVAHPSIPYDLQKGHPPPCPPAQHFDQGQFQQQQGVPQVFQNWVQQSMEYPPVQTGFPVNTVNVRIRSSFFAVRADWQWNKIGEE
jgi:hypothetical protein